MIQKKKAPVKKSPVKKAVAKKPVAKKKAPVRTTMTTVVEKKVTVKKNPVPQSVVSKLKQAVELFENFTGHEAEFYEKVMVDWPDVSIKVGVCTGIMYETVRDGRTERYLHKFKKHAAPVLVAAHDGKMVALIGGDYTFTERGIVDN